jgi:8-oxo-dGTP pyrophosphatase MutT (NUDIX family)
LRSAGRSITRPVDAAGLVLIRSGADGPEVLLGRRHRRAGFLPDIYVVPGGRVDADDLRHSGFAEALHPHVAAQLAKGSGGRPALAFARAAIRETFEETGLLVTGGDGSTNHPTGAPIWHTFGARNCRPGFDRLDFVCRAITPTSSKRRYNTRFFLADGAAVSGDLGGDGELEDLNWWPVAAFKRLTIVDVTEFVLAEALRRWHLRIPIGSEPAPLFCYRGDGPRWRIIGRGGWNSPPPRVFSDA